MLTPDSSDSWICDAKSWRYPDDDERSAQNDDAQIL